MKNIQHSSIVEALASNSVDAYNLVKRAGSETVLLNQNDNPVKDRRINGKGNLEEYDTIIRYLLDDDIFDQCCDHFVALTKRIPVLRGKITYLLDGMHDLIAHDDMFHDYVTMLLGDIYQYGLMDVVRSTKQALLYYQRAWDTDNEAAAGRLRDLYKALGCNDLYAMWRARTEDDYRLNEPYIPYHRINRRYSP